MWGLAFLLGMCAFFMSFIKCALYEDVTTTDRRAALGGVVLILVALVGFVFDAYWSIV
jgi:hypothetical protein